MDEPSHQYFVYSNRLASFHSQKRRGSNVASRTGRLAVWPHENLSPGELANAGFFFSPQPSSPDNVICFLCRKRLDGWEAGDDPITEHVRHSATCAWAVLAAVEAGIEPWAIMNPTLPEMMEARKATFADKWPHEAKKGWKCKTKQMVDAGWKYTPTLDSDDMASCPYCHLALDGWEPSDKPLDEHFRRAPNCPFFILSSNQGTGKKAGRSKGIRASNASRLSVQSVAAVGCYHTLHDSVVDLDESDLTTTSPMAQASRRGGALPKKRGGTASTKATAMARKLRVKKHELAEEAAGTIPPSVSTLSRAKSNRGRKRRSDAVEDAVLSTAEGPAAKKRVTRSRASIAVAIPVESAGPKQTAPPLVQSSHSPPPARTTRVDLMSRKRSAASVASLASTTSTRGPPGAFPDDTDDEILRQLQEDLSRQDDEDDKVVGAIPLDNAAMFDLASPQFDEAALDDELQQLQQDMELEQNQSLVVAVQAPIKKKGREKATRKVSKPHAVSERTLDPPMAKEVEQDVKKLQTEEAEAGRRDDITAKKQPLVPEVCNHDASIYVASYGTVIHAATVEKPTQKRVVGPGGKPIVSLAQPERANAPRPARNPTPPRSSSDCTAQSFQSASELERRAEHGAKPMLSDPRASIETTVHTTNQPIRQQQQQQQHTKNKSPAPAPPPPPHAPQAPVPSTPPSRYRPTYQSILSPSQSPQSSDAENRPPSSRHAGMVAKSHAFSAKHESLAHFSHVLPPVPTPPAPAAAVAAAPAAAAATPTSRRAALRSIAQPWSAVDIDTVLSALLPDVAVPAVVLSTPEREMTVAQWVYHNASVAEARLRGECEGLVSRLESEGGRAMAVLEGLVVE